MSQKYPEMSLVGKIFEYLQDIFIVLVRLEEPLNVTAKYY